MKRISILIKGRVQGVFYRASARDVARQFDIKGFVRNEPDGNVFLEAEGTEDKLQKLVAWCKKGPPLAHVSGVEVKEWDDMVYYSSFEISR